MTKKILAVYNVILFITKTDKSQYFLIISQFSSTFIFQKFFAKVYDKS